MADYSAPHQLAQTRLALHQVAEHVLGPAVYCAAGRIDLRQGPGGFRTPPYGEGFTVAGVDGTDVVLVAGGRESRAPLTTVREAAAFVGVQPGFPKTLYEPATPYDPDRLLSVHAEAARTLADWYALGQKALTDLATGVPEDEPTQPQLWPEHFDLAMVAAGVDYGFSPGDEHYPDPYVYVGPFEGPQPGDAFWNAPFGAMRTIHQIGSAADAVAFLREGRTRAHASREQTGST